MKGKYNRNKELASACYSPPTSCEMETFSSVLSRRLKARHSRAETRAFRPRVCISQSELPGEVPPSISDFPIGGNIKDQADTWWSGPLCVSGALSKAPRSPLRCGFSGGIDLGHGPFYLWSLPQRSRSLSFVYRRRPQE